MNLLPRPRVVEFSGRLLPWEEAACTINTRLPSQGYELEINEDGVKLAAADDAGVFYGRTTLRQLSRVCGGRLPQGVIRDWPDVLNRAVMIDISRNKVPTLTTLCELVERLASWKVNQLQLYTEHTFAYSGHSIVHQSASPITAEDVRVLDEYCARHFIELVPNQNCLGHMEQWLRHTAYRELALTPDGFCQSVGFGLWRAAMTLDPANPRSLRLVRELLGELVPLFKSRRIHVGLDEPWELPSSRIGDYMEWIQRLRSLPELATREILIWGDVISGTPNILRDLPKGVTVCEWGYEASHPFDENCATLASGGVPFVVVPGTSSWLSIIGRVTNAKKNCYAAAEAALRHRATGYMIADWGDHGHLQQFPISDPGLAYGAAVSWCLASNRDIDLHSALSLHAYRDSSGELANALMLLGDAYLVVTPQMVNASALLLHLYYPQVTLGCDHTYGLLTEHLDHLIGVFADAKARLERARPTCVDGNLLIEEVHWSVEIVELIANDAKARLAGDGSLASVHNRVRQRFAERLSELIEEYRRLWAGRNRPGGLEDSLSWLYNLKAAYATGLPTADWAGYRTIYKSPSSSNEGSRQVK